MPPFPTVIVAEAFKDTELVDTLTVPFTSRSVPVPFAIVKVPPLTVI